jgi:exodeoxyribonuclease VII small subunit
MVDEPLRQDSAMKEKRDEKPFDAGMAELEAVVARLERGELPLEDALAAFEAGVALVRQLTERLNAAEARVDVLTRDAEGRLTLEPLEAGSETGGKE